MVHKRKYEESEELEQGSKTKCPHTSVSPGCCSFKCSSTVHNNSEKSEECVRVKKVECENVGEDGGSEEEVLVETCVEQNSMSREFDVLDEYGECNEENDGDDDAMEEDSGSEGSFEGSYDSDIPDEEIEAMLEEGLSEEFRRKPSMERAFGSGENSPYEEREKVVLEEKGHNHFDVLPEGWVQVTHNSGMPIYLHKPTRVCTLSKPYFLGPGSAR
ncbi:hypothetical protein J437_LFUL016298, partial [Ladona fulva]